jgi:hypothetical protein
MKRMYQVLCILAIVSLLISCSKEKDDKTIPRADIEGLESVVLSITEIGDEYFLAEHPWASPSRYKVFAALNEELCEGDYVDVYYEELIEISEHSYEITPQLVELSDFKLKPGVAYKPVIYLYPTEVEEVFVTLDYNGILTHTYPNYSNGWSITAYPNGILVDDKGTEYPYLFWEGESDIEYDMSKGFCVSGDETEQFLRNKLTFMGLNQKELEDFIEFWVPFMEKNPYNKISFQFENYTENAKLTVNPEPKSILRVYMVFQPLDEFDRVEEQALTKFERTGFTLIEWGGSIIK